MAVPAQFSSLALLAQNTHVSDLHNVFANFHYQGGQPLFNGTVLSEPESELTYNNNNNMSGSNKRNREGDEHHSHEFKFPKLPKTQRLVYGSEAAAAAATSTSGRSSSGKSPFLNTSSNAHGHGLNAHLLQQNLEIDALILLQNEKLRAGLQETRKRHCKSMLSLIELQVLKRLEEKEHELANASRRNAELEERVKQMSAENQVWFNVAKNNEAIVFTLKSSLEQILLQNQGQLREGFGDSDSVVDDAQSCSSTSMAGDKTHKKKCCKVCQENEVSVLMLPCRHLCLCKSCECKIDACPICNCTKNASLQIFLS